MPKVIMTKGLPGAGKSTWSRKVCLQNPGQYKLVDKDSLRELLDCGTWSKANEAFLLNIRDHIVEQALTSGLHVIVHDTNFHHSHETRLRELAEKHGAEFEIKLFDTALSTCIEWDAARPKPVGEKIIRGMYNNEMNKNSNV